MRAQFGGGTRRPADSARASSGPNELRPALVAGDHRSQAPSIVLGGRREPLGARAGAAGAQPRAAHRKLWSLRGGGGGRNFSLSLHSSRAESSWREQNDAGQTKGDLTSD